MHWRCVTYAQVCKCRFLFPSTLPQNPPPGTLRSKGLDTHMRAVQILPLPRTEVGFPPKRRWRAKNQKAKKNTTEQNVRWHSIPCRYSSPVAPPPPSPVLPGPRPEKSKVPPPPVVTPVRLAYLTAVRHGPLWTSRATMTMSNYFPAADSEHGLPQVGNYSVPICWRADPSLPQVARCPFCHSHATKSQGQFSTDTISWN